MKLLLAMLVQLSLVCARWDPFGLHNIGRGTVQELVDKLTKEFLPAAKAAINDEMNILFDDKLPDLIEEANKAMADVIDHAEDEAEIFLNYFIGNVSALAEGIIDEAGKMMDHTIEEISAALDDFVDVHLTGLVDHVFAGINSVLTRVEQDVQQLICEEEAIITQFETWVDEKTTPLDCECVLKVKTAWAQPCECTCSDKLPPITTCHCSPASWVTTEDQIAYEYTECKIRRSIESGQLPVDKIVTLLDGLRTLGEQLRCYHLKGGSHDLQMKRYTDHVLNISKEIYIWSNPTNSNNSSKPVAV